MASTVPFFDNKKQLYVALLAPVIILFFKTLQFDFTTLDEQWMVVKNSDFLSRWSSVKDCFTKPITHEYYRPVLMFSFLLDYQIGKLSPTTYHFTNLALHLLCVFFLFRFLELIAGSREKAFWFSFLFALHPLVTHAVAWIPGRNDELLFLFTVLSLYQLQKVLKTKSSKNIVLQLMFYCLALLTKESAIVLPFVFSFALLISKEEKGRLLKILPALWILITILFLLLRNAVMEGTEPMVSFSAPAFKNFMLAIFSYLGKVVLPIHQSVLPLVENVSVVIGIASLALIIWLLVTNRFNDKKLAWYGIFIFFTLLLLPSWFGAFKGSGEHYEHRVYTSFIGAALFATQIKLTLNATNRRILLFVSVILFFKTFYRLNVYKDKYIFTETGIKERPDHYLFYVQKGEFEYRKHNFSEAEKLFSKGLALRPDKADLYSNRGSALFAMGRFQEASQNFSQAIQLSEFKPEYFINRCRTYTKLNEWKNAAADLEKLEACCQEMIPQKLREEVRSHQSEGD